MEQERNEVFERIPWENLEEKKGDRQWLVFGVAGALVVGALAYSVMSNRPAPVVTVTTAPTAAGSTAPPPPVAAVPAPPMAAAVATTTPILTAEADLYAVSPERVIDQVMAHAEWFVAEYLTVDGSEEGREVLASLLPSGVPLPAAPEGMRVFVEWVRALSVEETGPLQYRVVVLARSLSASGDEAYRRQLPVEVTVDVSMTGESPQVMAAPMMAPAPLGPPAESLVGAVPEEIAAAAMEQSGGSEVVGGHQDPTGGWQVVVMVTGADGVSRPASVPLP